MNIDNAGNEIRGHIDPTTKSANRFAIFVVVMTFLLALLALLLVREFFTDIAHAVELVQAVLVCSTALMALSGLMIIEIKKTNVMGLSSDNMFEKITALNTITSLAKAYVFLRWVLLLSIGSIVLSGLYLMNDDTVFIIGSLTTFLAQIYLFIWGLMFLDFLPS